MMKPTRWTPEMDLATWLSTLEQPVLLIDAGGVLFNNVIEESTFILDVAKLLRVNAESLMARYCLRDSEFEKSHVVISQVLAECARHLGGCEPDADCLAQIDASYVSATIPNEEVFLALTSARKTGKKLVLANNEAEHWDRIKNDAYGHFHLFHEHASSWRVGAIKPTPQYFAELDRMLWPAPRAQWHMLDDNPEVIEQARAQGISATLFLADHRSDRSEDIGDE